MPADAQWCTLCFAVQNAPVPDREPVSVSAALPQPEADVAPLPAPGPRHAAPAGAALPMPAESATVPAAVPLTPKRPTSRASETTWPCPRCGDQVALSLDACTSCGAGFLSGAASELSTKVPGIGDFGSMSSAQRWLTAAGLAVGLIVVFTVLAFVVGKIF